jgi:transcriptional regulator with XRE-family HTH domain
MVKQPSKPRQPVAPRPLSVLFSANLAALMQVDRSLSTQLALAKASGVAQTSIGRILRHEQSPTLDMVDRLAATFHLEPWQMLVADFDPTNPPITKQVDDRQRELWQRFKLAAEALASYSPQPPG